MSEATIDQLTTKAVVDGLLVGLIAVLEPMVAQLERQDARLRAIEDVLGIERPTQ